MSKVISLGSAVATYVFLLNFMEDELYSPVGPVLFVGVMAFFVADSFVGLLGMASISSPPPVPSIPSFFFFFGNPLPLVQKNALESTENENASSGEIPPPPPNPVLFLA